MKIDGQEIDRVDLLSLMFSHQLSLMNKIHETNKERRANSNGFMPSFNTMEGKIWYTAECISQEAHELKNTTDWKKWKTAKGFNIEEAQEELADILHYVIQGAIQFEMSPKELFDLFWKKHKKNVERQDNGY